MYFEINNTIFFCVFLDKNIINIMEKVSPDFFKLNIAKIIVIFMIILISLSVA